MASSMNGKYGSLGGDNNNETFFSCRLCNRVFKGAHTLMVHFDLAHTRKNGHDHLLKPNSSEPTKVSPRTPPLLASFPSQTSSWKIQESAVKINHLSGQRVANDPNPIFGSNSTSNSSSGGKAPSLLHSNKNHYAAWPYPSPTSHTNQVQKPKPNIGNFLGPRTTPSQLPSPVSMTSHAPQPWMQTPSPSQEANHVLEAGSAADDDYYLCTKCKLAKQLHRQGIQVQKSGEENSCGKLDLSLKL